ncbi:hypothetical protein Tco_1283838 [Tanacetum coccineum]
MRFKKHVTFRKSIATSRKLRKGRGSANNGEGCSKSVGGYVNDGEGYSKSVGGSFSDGEGCSKDMGGSASPRPWDYKQEILDSNLGSTCVLDIEELDSGAIYFKRFYVCFKGVKDGWLEGCRRVIGLDGCFLKHTCKGIAALSMCYVICKDRRPVVAMSPDLSNLGSVILDSHKGLLEAVVDWLPHAEHRKCTRHVYANFKRKIVIMRQNAMDLEDIITQSVRRQLKKLKTQQRNWVVIPSGFQELEVRKGDECYGVNLVTKQLNGIPKKNGLVLISSQLNQFMELPFGKRQVGQNKKTCDKDPVPKTPKPRKPPSRKSQTESVVYASSRGRGRGSKGGGRGRRSTHAGRGGSGRGRVGQEPQEQVDEDELRNALDYE